jgi:hypothetical protein
MEGMERDVEEVAEIEKKGLKLGWSSGDQIMFG